MITVAPAMHDFGTIHTERKGNATLFLGNPTFADAEWSLSHVPAPPPKIRRLHAHAPTAASTLAANSEVTAATTGAGARGGTTGRDKNTARASRSVAVDDPSVFVFGEKAGVAPGVKLPLKSAAACLPEDWNRFEVRVDIC